MVRKQNCVSISAVTHFFLFLFFYFSFLLTLPPQFVYMEKENKTTKNYYRTNLDALSKENTSTKFLPLWSTLQLSTNCESISTVNQFKSAWSLSKAPAQVWPGAADHRSAQFGREEAVYIVCHNQVTKLPGYERMHV